MRFFEQLNIISVKVHQSHFGQRHKVGDDQHVVRDNYLHENDDKNKLDAFDVIKRQSVCGES